MLNTLHKIFKLIFLFSVVTTGWTSFVLLTNSKFNLEIKVLIHKMYLNQKSFVLNVKDLSFLLVKDANERFSENKSLNNSIK
tara:strand:- start:448 stop:693 length:246 start_codon:yes stop_codon:yes gene_type:complete